MYTLYLIVNKVNGKVYIGQTSCGLSKRWSRHKYVAEKDGKTYLYSSIKKYGISFFDIVKIDEGEDKDTADELEKRYIREFKSYLSAFGYNLTFGGDGGTPTPETRAKMSRSLTGRRHSENTKRKMSCSRKGKVFSEETKAKISASNKGKHSHSVEIKTKISLANKGRQVSDETRRKMANSHRKIHTKEAEKCLQMI